MLKQKIVINNKLGLHARASAKLVSTASRYGSTIQLIRNDRSVNGKSIMGVMMLAAAKGTELEVHVHGDDENDAMQAIIDLIKNRFGEPD